MLWVVAYDWVYAVMAGVVLASVAMALAVGAAWWEVVPMNLNSESCPFGFELEPGDRG